MNANDIQNNAAALAAAQAGDWAACAVAMQSVSITATPSECGAAETAAAIAAAHGGGHDAVRRSMLAALEGDHDGKVVLAKLASDGVAWAHDLTRPLIESLVAGQVCSRAVADALYQLSAPVSYPHASVTAEQCQQVWTLHTTQQRNDNWQERFNNAMNQIGTAEQAVGVAAVRLIANEMEAI